MSTLAEFAYRMKTILSLLILVTPFLALSADTPLTKPTEITVSNTKLTGITDLKRYDNDEVAIYHADGIARIRIDVIPSNFLVAWGIAPQSSEQQTPLPAQQTQQTLQTLPDVFFNSGKSIFFNRSVTLGSGDYKTTYSIGCYNKNDINISQTIHAKFSKTAWSSVYIERSHIQAFAAILDKYFEWVKITKENKLTGITKPIATVGGISYSFSSPDELLIKVPQRAFADDDPFGIHSGLTLDNEGVNAIKGLLEKLPELEKEIVDSYQNDARSKKDANKLLK